jgi:hypothetical protein
VVGAGRVRAHRHELGSAASTVVAGCASAFCVTLVEHAVANAAPAAGERKPPAHGLGRWPAGERAVDGRRGCVAGPAAAIACAAPWGADQPVLRRCTAAATAAAWRWARCRRRGVCRQRAIAAHSVRSLHAVAAAAAAAARGRWPVGHYPTSVLYGSIGGMVARDERRPGPAALGCSGAAAPRPATSSRGWWW